MVEKEKQLSNNPIDFTLLFILIGFIYLVSGYSISMILYTLSPSIDGLNLILFFILSGIFFIIGGLFVGLYLDIKYSSITKEKILALKKKHGVD